METIHYPSKNDWKTLAFNPAKVLKAYDQEDLYHLEGTLHAVVRHSNDWHKLDIITNPEAPSLDTCVIVTAGTCETDRVATLQEGDKVAVTGTIELENGTLRLKDAKFVAPKAAQEELLDAFVVPKHNEKGLRGAGFTPVKLGGSLNAAA